MTDQIVMSRTPGAFRTVLVPRGSSKAEWLELRSEVEKAPAALRTTARAV
jgi:hypothetical protein